MISKEQKQLIQAARKKVVAQLNTRQNDEGYWDGHLSSSALSTALAVLALWKYDSDSYESTITAGLKWLVQNINTDGGWGDTTHSPSNLSTTLLSWSALAIVKDDPAFKHTITNAESWITHQVGSLQPQAIVDTILNHYGEDQTFSVPILTACAIAGRLGDNLPWDFVPQLPFELAACPQSMFKMLNLNVVSYALPALIAIGLVRHRMNATRNPLMKFIRNRLSKKVLTILETKQPSNGGLLEATPLTAFVLMSLVTAGEDKCHVTKQAVHFLIESMRSDGSWPIDTNLATWVTTLSIKALGQDLQHKDQVKWWLLNQQYTEMHPFTNAEPGGWAWTDLPGGVPDADDTAGALIALHQLGSPQSNVHVAEKAITWLLNLQNSDHGIPTFCKGWGKLPFDKSCPDITAHALHALAVWEPLATRKVKEQIRQFIPQALSYLAKSQQKNGSWLPLWFGNQYDPTHSNPVYGTSIVIAALAGVQKCGFEVDTKVIYDGTSFLMSAQNNNNGWGGNFGIESTIEETALACKALIAARKKRAAANGLLKLAQMINETDFTQDTAKPIGLYFASLWYSEQMYPLTFACAALNNCNEILEGNNET